MNQSKKPLLFLIFNRLQETKLVFEEIRKYKPSQFFIAADGPRENIQEYEICNAIRNYVIENIDWECEVYTLFRDQNLGCGKAVSSSITWFFEQVEDGIILEDDCLPSQHFFIFCEKLLDIYKNDQKVMHISGFNYLGEIKYNNQYLFSQFSSIWGWATWRRAWDNYIYDISLYDNLELDNKLVFNSNNDFNQLLFWRNYIKVLNEGKINTWDLQWQLSIWYNDSVSILPAQNLVSNIGFSPEALHTKNVESPLANLSTVLSNIKFRFRKKKIKINTNLSDYIFYYAHFELYNIKKSEVKSKKIPIQNSLYNSLKRNDLTIRDKFYLIRLYLKKIIYD